VIYKEENLTRNKLKNFIKIIFFNSLFNFKSYFYKYINVFKKSKIYKMTETGNFNFI